MKEQAPLTEVNRRNFLGSLAGLATTFGAVELALPGAAAEPGGSAADRPKVRCGVIGIGSWGRELIMTLSRLPQAEVVGVCDNYPLNLRRGGKLAPGAQAVDDYRRLIEDPQIQAVVVATPTHQHRQMVLDALQAGKHVYCEAPLAHTIDEARVIARAARGAPKFLFQAGLQNRSAPIRHALLPHLQAGAHGRNVQARAQWHKKQSWRKTSVTGDREKELNWRLDAAISPGLVGEIGIHQLDAAGWFYSQRPLTVTGFGSIIQWSDGRQVPDTVQAVVEYPGGVRLFYNATLGNSFDAEYEIYYGTDAAIMLRDGKAWLFKEADAPQLGWEVTAPRETFYKEVGIALAANATKTAAPPDKATAEASQDKPPLYQALADFTSRIQSGEVGSPAPSATPALQQSSQPRPPAAGAQEGFVATVVALTANEAVRRGEKLVYQKEWFELG